MIIYFSGTGNSKLVAKRICDILDDGIISINEYLKYGKNEIIKSDEPLVFVLPTYGWRIPKIVHEWIKKTCFEGNSNAYFALTCGGGVGNAYVYAKKLCEEKNLQFCGLSRVLMPENYIVLDKAPCETECKNIINRSIPVIEVIAMHIRHGEMLQREKVSFRDRLLSGPINKIFYSLIVHDKGFNVTNSCNSCGKCTKRCALNNIEMIDGRPVWKGNCTHCMACICGCPTAAIEYKKVTKNKRRYYVM